MPELSRLEQYLKDLDNLTTDPVHKLLIAAYKGVHPKESMEQELGRLLMQVVKRED